MTQNPPDQPGGQPGPYGSPEQYGAGDPRPSGSPDQQGQPGEQPYGVGQQQSYGTAPAGQPYAADPAQQPYAAAGSAQPGPGGPTGPSDQQPGGPAGPPPGGRRSNPAVIAGIVIGGLVVLALLIWGAITLIDSRDDTIPTPTPTATADPSGDGSADADAEPTDGEPSDDASGPAPGGELYDLLSTEAAEVQDGSGTTWTVQGDWADASDLSADATEAYTATYTSDAGEITMTAISFPDPSAADAYAAGVQDERGDPDYSGDVWQSDQGSGLGTRIDYDGDVYSIYWYDDTAVVYQIDAPDVDTAQGFYGSLPF